MVKALETRVQSLWCLRLKVQGSGFRVHGSELRFPGLGFRV
jgi:hypothetical protein